MGSMVVESELAGEGDTVVVGTDHFPRGPTPTMIGRRIAAWLSVLLAHALIINVLLDAPGTAERAAMEEAAASEPITMYLEPLPSADIADEEVPTLSVPRLPIAPPEVAVEVPAAESAAITAPARVDWPIEGKKSVARVLAAEAEAERIARMFAGPNGTWASLTRRQRSKISKFRWKAGVDGLERDENGNTIYHLSEGCVLVNFVFIACSIGKPKIHDDMFENMRLYFDEQRLPRTDEGNGTEPEAQPRR